MSNCLRDCVTFGDTIFEEVLDASVKKPKNLLRFLLVVTGLFYCVQPQAAWLLPARVATYINSVLPAVLVQYNCIKGNLNFFTKEGSMDANVTFLMRQVGTFLLGASLVLAGNVWAAIQFATLASVAIHFMTAGNFTGWQFMIPIVLVNGALSCHAFLRKKNDHVKEITTKVLMGVLTCFAIEWIVLLVVPETFLSYMGHLVLPGGNKVTPEVLYASRIFAAAALVHTMLALGSMVGCNITQKLAFPIGVAGLMFANYMHKVPCCDSDACGLITLFSIGSMIVSCPHCTGDEEGTCPVAFLMSFFNKNKTATGSKKTKKK